MDLRPHASESLAVGDSDPTRIRVSASDLPVDPRADECQCRLQVYSARLDSEACESADSGPEPERAEGTAARKKATPGDGGSDSRVPGPARRRRIH